MAERKLFLLILILVFINIFLTKRGRSHDVWRSATDADRIYVVPKFVRKSTLKMFFVRSIKVYL